MQVVLLTNGMVMVFADEIPPAGRAWCEGLDRMGRWQELLPELVARPDVADIEWMIGDWDRGGLYPVPHTLIEGIARELARPTE